MKVSSFWGSEPSKVSGARGLARAVGSGGVVLFRARRCDISSRRSPRRDWVARYSLWYGSSVVSGESGVW
jgi:hypothetical protein